MPPSSAPLPGAWLSPGAWLRMAHPDDDRIVPACVQHAVLDQQENQVLLQLLPTRRAGR